MSIMIILMISLSATLVIKSGVIHGLSHPIDSAKQELEEKKKDEKTITGEIIDSTGTVIASTDSIGGNRKYIDPYAYSSVVSYHSGGLEYIYYDELYGAGNKEYKDSNDETYYLGSDIHITIDHSLQKLSYDLISGQEDASIVVLDSTGRVKAMTSSNTFDINTVEDDYSEISSEEGSLMNPAKDYHLPCGSVLKPIIGQCLIERNADYTVFDKGSITLETGEVIRNAGSVAHGNLDLERAMKASSNVFFISAGKYLGGRLLEEKYNMFKIGDSFNTDFGEIASSKEPINNDYDLAMNAIGQHTYISTVHLASIMQAITTGTMKQPYMVEKIVQDGKVVKRGENTVLSDLSVSEETISHMNAILAQCAASYGLSQETCGVNVLAKTGTAEVETKEGPRTVATLLIALPSQQYFIAIQSRNTEGKWGSDLSEIGASLIQYLR